MSRRLFRKLTPKSAATVGETKLGRAVERIAGPVLKHRRYWQLNRKAVARGVAAGTFWAFIPLPIQSIGSILTAIWLKGNIPLAWTFTWISNPVTWVPVFYAGYRVGLAVTGQPEASGLGHELERLMNEGVWAGTKGLIAYFGDNLDRVFPLLLGCGMLGTLSAGTGYWGVKALWRWNIVRRWDRRGHHVRCPHCRKLVLGGGEQPHVLEKQCPHCGKTIPLYRRVGIGLAAMHRRLRDSIPSRAEKPA